jgi:hypothetical protein
VEYPAARVGQKATPFSFIKEKVSAVAHRSLAVKVARPQLDRQLVSARGQRVVEFEAAAEAGKTGFVYIVNRLTGKLIRRSEAFVPRRATLPLRS